jgi:predicted Zn-dependent protease
MMMFLAWLGFSAKMVHDQESFLVGKMGEKITGGDITIYDDSADVRTMGLPFDFEGVPKQKLMLIENGVATGYAHNWKTAAKESVASTGHYIGREEPLPVNLVMAPGDKTKDDLIASTDYGILISRFHYPNVVNPMETVITGMTRDGTFLIEGGKITKGLKNFRFTQNILTALANNEGLTREQRFSSAFFGGGAVVPVAKVKDFNFSGKTDF